MTVKKFVVIDRHGDIRSTHKTLELANKKLKAVDTVRCCLYAGDVPWLKNFDECYQGYKYRVEYLENEKAKKGNKMDHLKNLERQENMLELANKKRKVDDENQAFSEVTALLLNAKNKGITKDQCECIMDAVESYLDACVEKGKANGCV